MFFFLLLYLVAATPADSETFQDTLRNGLLALQRNEVPAALSYLESAANLQPKNARVWVALSQAYWKAGDWLKAEESARKASAFADNDSAVLQALVIYYGETNHAWAAADAQARYSALNPTSATAAEKAVFLYFQAAQPLLERQDFGGVISMLEAVPPKIGRNAQLQLELGVAYYGVRRFDQAAQAFLLAIDLEPSVKQPYIFLGKMLDQIPSHLEAATARFIAFESANSGDYEGYLLHAKVLNARNVEPETARTLLEKALAMRPDSADAHFELGSLLDKTQHFAEAAAEFEKASALNPSDAAAHYRLSRLYQRLNKPEAAMAERERHRKIIMAQTAGR